MFSGGYLQIRNVNSRQKNINVSVYAAVCIHSSANNGAANIWTPPLCINNLVRNCLFFYTGFEKEPRSDEQ